MDVGIGQLATTTLGGNVEPQDPTFTITMTALYTHQEKPTFPPKEGSYVLLSYCISNQKSVAPFVRLENAFEICVCGWQLLLRIFLLQLSLNEKQIHLYISETLIT